MNSFRTASVLATVLGLSAFSVRGATLAELVDQVPPPPRDVATALRWVENGQIVWPEYTQFKKAIDAERAALASFEAPSPAPLPSAASPAQVEGVAQAYDEYVSENAGKKEAAAVLGKRARWLHAAMAGPLGKLLGDMAPCPAPCKDPASIPQDPALMAQKRRLGEQDLKQWTTLFEDWKRVRLPLIREAPAVVTGGGEGLNLAATQPAIARYRAAMLREVDLMLSVTEMAVRRIDAIERGDVDAVSASTYSPKARPKAS